MQTSRFPPAIISSSEAVRIVCPGGRLSSALTSLDLTDHSADAAMRPLDPENGIWASTSRPEPIPSSGSSEGIVDSSKCEITPHRGTAAAVAGGDAFLNAYISSKHIPLGYDSHLIICRLFSRHACKYYVKDYSYRQGKIQHNILCYSGCIIS